MEHATIIGIDLAKRSFQLHGTRADGSVAFRRKLSRDTMLRFVAAQPRCVVAMEACASAHHWGREIGKLGHTVKLVPTDLREAVREAAEERRGGRGGDLRGGLAADDALRSGEDARAAGSGHAVPHARPAGSLAHPDDQRPTGTFGRVRRCRSAGTGLCRAAGRGDRRRRLGAAGPGPRAGGAVARSGRRPRRGDRGAGARTA